MASQDIMPKAERKSRIMYIDARLDPAAGTPIWYKLGRDNDDLSREYGWEENDLLNVLGEFVSDNKISSNTVSADPFYARIGDDMASLLYMFDETRADLDRVKRDYAEVVIDLEAETVVYAFIQPAYILIQSVGGPSDNADNIPFNLKLTGKPQEATYNIATESFTPVVTP